MNKNELQVLIDYTKGMIKDNKEPEKKVIIALCDELERITNLNPVGYITPVSGLLLRRKQKSFIHPDKSEVNIPLYRLDK